MDGERAPASSRTTYVLVDGENIDATLGGSILGRRPRSDERPRWDRLLQFAEETWRQPVTGLFFLAANNDLPMAFVQALLALDYRPIPLAGAPGEKVVDIGIQRTLDAIEGRPGDVLLVTHDVDFLPQVTRLVDAGRRVGVLGFREFVSARFAELAGSAGLKIYDLEDDVAAFTSALPRVRIIPIDAFDPARYL